MSDLPTHLPAAALGLWLCISLAANAADMCVAPNGSDAWSGRLPAPNAARTDGPLATLRSARDATRKLDPQEPRRIIVREGGRMKRFPGAPAAMSTAAMLADAPST